MNPVSVGDVIAQQYIALFWLWLVVSIVFFVITAVADQGRAQPARVAPQA